VTSLDVSEALKVSIFLDVLIIPGCTPWKLISSLTTLASTQRGNTLRIENIGSTSWKPLCSNSGHALDDNDDILL